jgi:hypothetical protein
MLLANRRQHLKALRRRHAAAKARRCAGWSGHPPAGRRRDPQLQRIGAAFNQRIDNFQRLLRSRIAKGDKGNERAFLAIFSCANSVS